MAISEIKQAVQYMRAGDTTKAVPLLERVTAQMPQYVTAHVLLARMYEAADRGEDALRTWEHAAFLLPGSPTIRAGVRRVLRRQPSIPATASSKTRTAERRDEASPSAASPAGTAPPGAPAEPPRAEAPASAAAAEALEAEGEDLDRLIEDLETARIVPRPDLDDIPEPDLDDDIDDMVSETLARIYSSQEQYGEAARIYEKLAAMDPDRAEEMEAKAEAMRAKAAEEE
ncbi:MAG: tetratricopeptide repeat protein [Bacteroidetes bacterium]|jgi:tetratricopeptide (TPR) repeat protein|nr:tetratricopeptide repeat protein [Bacteroidota bacterium]